MSEIESGIGIVWQPDQRRLWRGPSLTPEGIRSAEVFDAMGRMLEELWSRS